VWSTAAKLERLSETIGLERIGCRLAMADIYDATGLTQEPPT